MLLRRLRSSTARLRSSTARLRASQARRHLVGVALAPVALTVSAVSLVVPLVVPLAVPVPAGAVPSGAVPSSADGSWTVEPSGPGTWRVQWTSPEPLPVTGDRPTITVAGEGAGGGLAEVGTSTVVGADGRTVESTILAEEVPDPEQLDVVLSGRALDEPAGDQVSGRVASWPTPDQRLLEVDPGQPGALPTRSDDYTLPAVRLPGMAQPVEMSGHVVEPAERSTTRPLVVLLHGRHGWCYRPGTGELGWQWPCATGQRPVPSHLGYDYLQRHLASLGYVTVSVAANGVNAQDGELPDGGAAARSRLVRAHLDQWATWVGRGARSADLRRVVLVGHSRGGEGVARATLDIPLSAPYQVAGQVLIAPTAFSRQSTPYIPAVTLLPYCDGDVVDLQGQAFTDGGRDVVPDDPALKSSVLVMGANHNYFNTEWTPGEAAAPAEDDSWLGGQCAPRARQRLSAADQRRVAAAYVTGAVRLFADGDEELRPMYDGSPVRLGSTPGAVVLSHALGGRALRRPGKDVAVAATGGGRAALCAGVARGTASTTDCGRYATSGMETPHWGSDDPPAPSARAAEVSWTKAGQRGVLTFATPWDLSRASSLDLRTVVDPRVAEVALAVRVTDAGGRTAEVRRSLAALPPAPGVFRGRSWAQVLRVESAALVAAGLDLRGIASVELVARSAQGRVWVLDVAARPTTPPPVVARRVPVVDLGQVTVAEGHQPAAKARVPFTVRGTVTTTAVLRVLGVDPDNGRVRSVDVTLQPGTRAGSVPWPYAGNRLDSLPHKTHRLYGYGMRHAMSADYLGAAVVTDDDPTPPATFQAVAATVPEGKRMVWRYRLARPVDYPVSVELVPVRGAGTSLRVDDLAPAWVRDWVWTPRASAPVHQATVSYTALLRPGRTSITLAVPTRLDSTREGREQLVARARTSEPKRVSGRVAVTVVDPRR